MSVDIQNPITEICERLGYSPDYVYRLDVEPTCITVHAYRGMFGFCDGPKFVQSDGTPALEKPKSFQVKT